jgi:hypothetical protein
LATRHDDQVFTVASTQYDFASFQAGQDLSRVLKKLGQRMLAYRHAGTLQLRAAIVNSSYEHLPYSRGI